MRKTIEHLAFRTRIMLREDFRRIVYDKGVALGPIIVCRFSSLDSVRSNCRRRNRGQ